MGRKSRQREEEAMAYEKEVKEQLRSHDSQGKKKVESLTWDKIIFGAVNSYREQWINDPSTWTNIRKTKNIDTLRLDMIRHVFGKYKCPLFLEKIWLPEKINRPRAQWNREHTEQKEQENALISYVPWYLAVAQGGSLFKSCSKGVLSKKETHSFIHSPKNYTIKQNIWWARAYCESNDNIGIAGRISQSKLIEKQITNEFWISVMRFFVRNPIMLSEMNDLIDFFHSIHRDNENYTLKGRSLEAVRRSCEEWHRFLNKQQSIGGGNWAGSELPNWSCTTGKDEYKNIWYMAQIKTGNDLLKEGQRMRHCVVSYKRDCMEGRCSIWSLTSKDVTGNKKHNLTIELNSIGEIKQARGLANRSPRSEENAVLDKWCSINNIVRRENRWY